MALSGVGDFGVNPNCPPLFNGSNYSTWKNHMKIHILCEGIKYWKVIIHGPFIPKNDNGDIQDELEYSDEDWEKVYVNAKAMKLILCALTIEEKNRMGSCVSAKDMWDRLRVTYEGTNQVRETKINMLLHEYEMFTMKDGESINAMLDRFGEIINGLSSLGKATSDSEQVKKILRSLPREWDSQVTAIMESKDLNTLGFNALVGSLINYEIILKSRSGRPKPKEKNLAMKASLPQIDESDGELLEGEEEDEEMALYARNLRKLKNMMSSRRKELRFGERRRGGFNNRRRNPVEEKKNFDNENSCYNCGRKGHYAKECKFGSSSRPQGGNDRYDKGKKKESFVATWSDDEYDDDNEETNLAFMAKSNDSSDEKDEVFSCSSNDLSDDDDIYDNDVHDAYMTLQIDFEKLLNMNIGLKKKNKELISENNDLKKELDECYESSSKIDMETLHENCLLKERKLTSEIDRLKKEFSYVVGKFTSGKEKFEELLSLQRFSISKNGLGCDPYERNSSLITKFTKESGASSNMHNLPTCDKCLKVGHNAYNCSSLRRKIKVKKVWVIKGTTLPNIVFPANQEGPNLAWVPMKKKNIHFVGTSKI